MNKSIILSIGKSCFLVCRGCYNHFSTENLIDAGSIINFAKHLKESYGINKITVGGGDPLSRGDIVFILKAIKALGYKVNLDTTGLPFLYDVKIIMNGSGTARKVPILDVIENVDVLGLPIDGPSEEINQKFRTGRDAVLSEILNLLNVLEDYKVKICINTVVHKNNFSVLKDIADLISKYKNIVVWQLFQFIPTGPIGYHNYRELLLDDKTYDRSMNILEKYCIKKGYSFVLEPKSRTRRKNIYLLIDSNGLMWCPETSAGTQEWNLDCDMTSKRISWGNIKDLKNLDSNIKKAFDYQGTAFN